MKKIDFTFQAIDGKAISATKWVPEGDTPRGIVQILHGMAEHRHRYDEFAEFLTETGFLCFAEDHRGHGETIADPSEEGFFADSDGWNTVLEDNFLLAESMRRDHPGLPLILFGHSMGSFLTRSYLIKHPENVAMAIVCGTAAGKGILGTAGKLVARTQAAFQGKKAKSPLLDKLSFGNFNGFFKPNRTDFDWLSRDNEKVDGYINDPACGFICTAGFFGDLLNGLSFINAPAQIARVPRELPVLLIAGEKDPVGDMGKGVRTVFRQYESAGHEDLEMRLYPDARHELLNETNRVEIFRDILTWMEERLSRQAIA